MKIRKKANNTIKNINTTRIEDLGLCYKKKNIINLIVNLIVNFGFCCVSKIVFF